MAIGLSIAGVLRSSKVALVLVLVKAAVAKASGAKTSSPALEESLPHPAHFQNVQQASSPSRCSFRPRSISRWLPPAATRPPARDTTPLGLINQCWRLRTGGATLRVEPPAVRCIPFGEKTLSCRWRGDARGCM